MVWARLIDYTNPCIVLLAIKVSQGRVLLKGVERYWPRCDPRVLRPWLIEAAKRFPSVLEHVKLTWLVECSRVCSHQLVRHRIASYTQESQRYSEDRIVLAVECLAEKIAKENASNETFMKHFEELLFTSYWYSVARIAGMAIDELSPEDRRECLSIAFDVDACWESEPVLGALALYAVTRKWGRKPEEARYFLPQCAKTLILVTMNLREFLHFYRLRSSSKAQKEIRELAEAMMREVEEKAIPWARDMARVFQAELYG